MRHAIRPSIRRVLPLAVMIGLHAISLAHPAAPLAPQQVCEPEWLPTLAPPLDGTVQTMTVFDDGLGGGPALFVGGSFTTAGGITVNRVAKWDGTNWSALGSGVGPTSASVRTLCAFDDGSGPALYCGGTFQTAGAVAVNNIAKWDGATWSDVGGGVTIPPGPFSAVVATLDAFQTPSGARLFVGGEFRYVGGQFCWNSAIWSGTAWTLTGSSGPVVTTVAFDAGAGGGPSLLASLNVPGLHHTYIEQWGGPPFAGVGSGPVSYGGISCMAGFDDGLGSGARLYACASDGMVPGQGIGVYTPTGWSTVGGGLLWPGGTAFFRDLLTFDDGTGNALFAAGSFTMTGGGVPANGLAKWNGTAWSPLGSGLQGARTLAIFEDRHGGGPALFVGGSFVNAPGAGDSYLAKWGCAPPFTSFCAGDGSGTACPCGNSGAPGNGCASATHAAGARLVPTGTPSLAADTALLTGSSMPNSSVLYFQGTAQAGGGSGVVFGDGLRCAAGAVIRLGTKTNVGGTSKYPGLGDPSLSVSGAVTAPGARTYQCWYRSVAAFCTPSPFNLSNGVRVTWAP